MPNLTEKLTDLYNNFAGFWTGIPLAINQINAKLDNLATMQADQAQMLTALQSIDGNTGDILSEATQIRQTITTANNRLGFILQALETITTSSQQQEAYLMTIQDLIGVQQGGDQSTVRSELLAIKITLGILQDAIGIQSTPSDGTAVYYLQQIANQKCCNAGNQPFDPTNPLLCAEPLVNTAVAEVFPEGSSSPIYQVATWLGVPSPFTSGNGLDLGVSNSTISRTTWAGYRAYVQSTSGAFTLWRNTGGVSYPTGAVINLEGLNTEYAFTVPFGETLTVYLCEGDGPLPTQCEQYTTTEQLSGAWAYTVNGIPGNYSIEVNDNYYCYSTSGAFVGGPFSANTPVPLGQHPSQPFIIRCGGGINEPARIVEICPPEEL